MSDKQVTTDLLNPDAGAYLLVVDDDRVARSLHRALLAKSYDVLTVSSGEEALRACQNKLPELILLDAEMPDMNGYETCRKLREWSDVPIIFATANTSIDEHLRAYDAGGNDLITKPVNADILLRKVSVAIHAHHAAQQIAREKEALSKMAMGFLSSVGQNGTLLNFMRTSLTCPGYRNLAEKLLEATASLGLECVVQIRHDDTKTALTAHGEPSPIELSILDNVASMGRLFQFKRRLVVNYDRVTIIVSNMPHEEDTQEAGVIRDNIAILAETAEALTENVDIRRESARQAERLQVALCGAESALRELGEMQRSMLGDVRIVLQDLVDDIEKAYAWLNTSNTQEATISATMDRAVQKILGRISQGGGFDDHFASVMRALNTGYNKDDNAVQLF